MINNQPTESEKRLLHRSKNHRRIAAYLQTKSDTKLLQLLSKSKVTKKGNGELVLPQINEKIFVKLLPLTNLEKLPENKHSTANLFQLPTYYQHRLGSLGFGAWRELRIHSLTNQWVESGQCPSFPLLIHWRILPIRTSDYSDKTEPHLWGNNSEIQQRTISVTSSTSSIVLFLEYFPLTLSQWLKDQLPHHSDPIEFITNLETALLKCLEFIHNHSILHMDAHLENFLTDGDQIYLTDYGLAISEEFQLDTSECQFFNKHKNLDCCIIMTSLCHAIVTHYDSEDDWRKTLRQLISEDQYSKDSIPDTIRSYLRCRAPIANTMGKFYFSLINDLTTPYPSDLLQKILDSF